jgi:oligoendopeptidase F
MVSEVEHPSPAIPVRAAVPETDRWNLSKLFPDDAAWETALREYEARQGQIDRFRDQLGESAETLRDALDLIHDLGLIEERLGYYAHLRVCEDLGDSDAQGRLARYTQIATAYAARSSFLTPEIQAIPDDTMQAWLALDLLEPYRIYLHKLLRYKPHVLSAAEERLLAMQAEFGLTARQGFEALTDVDMQFGEISDGTRTRPLTHATYASFLQHPDPAIRRKAYLQYMAEFEAHAHTLAALYAGSVQKDIYHARVRGYPSAREASLFHDDVPAQVYDQLIDTVHTALPALHRYYALRRQRLGLEQLHIADIRAPLVADVHTRYTYEEAVDLVVASLAPLGEEYTSTLRQGLLGKWVDRYENKGKRSGAFSAASYCGDPYILMNYKEDVLNDVFTLTHEAGHSMHSWYSVRHQPFQHYSYTIFVAEVASTFNEQWLADYLLSRTDNPQLRAYLLNKQVDDMVATLFRQTMFAEFERDSHALIERQEALTLDAMRHAYNNLLATYLGPEVEREDNSALECLRIPHFYSAFYVYKYATGMAAALALYQRVRDGGDAERESYLDFLKSGGSAFPLDQLRTAGVDMTSATPVQTALQLFESKVHELETVLGNLSV